IKNDMIAGSDTDLTDPTNATDLVTVAALNNATGGAGPIPAECYANANVHCALVTSYVAASGTQGQEGYVPAHAVAEWTVMAN
ncbi:MAG: hypothetical protein II630_07515, partial [Bacteroidales bacterium]|nr:hypothetical protein [Bacteroidales bacterium]